MAVAYSTEQQLAWEARQRPRAGIAAVIAAVLTFGADIWSVLAFRAAPHAGFLESLQNAARPGPVGATPSIHTAAYLFYDAHEISAIASSVILAIGLVGLGWALTFVAAATRARRPEMPRFAMYMPLIGAILQAVASILRATATSSAISNFLSGPHTVDRAADVSSSSLLVASAFIGFVGQVALAAGLVLVCLNAMRAGLLTRFMGVLGIIVGVLQILPFGALPVLQAFWLLALGALLLGLRPGGEIPTAWRSGRAEPWPTQAEVAAQRKAAAETRRGNGRAKPPATRAAPPEKPQAAARPAGTATGTPAKRKRKRRH